MGERFLLLFGGGKEPSLEWSLIIFSSRGQQKARGAAQPSRWLEPPRSEQTADGSGNDSESVAKSALVQLCSRNDGTLDTN